MRSRVVPAAAILTLAFFSAAVSADTWTVPGTVNASGLNGTVSFDLAVTNPARLLSCDRARPRDGTAPPVLLNPTDGHPEPPGAGLGASGAGATVVTAAPPLLIRA